MDASEHIQAVLELEGNEDFSDYDVALTVVDTMAAQGLLDGFDLDNAVTEIQQQVGYYR